MTATEPDHHRQGAATTAPYSYRGGFSTSICDDLFGRPTDSHTDCCALTCCGILLYDRNVFVLTNKRPSWKDRCCKVCVLLGLTFLWFVFMLAYAFTNPQLAIMDDDDNDETNDNDTKETKVHDNSKKVKQQTFPPSSSVIGQDDDEPATPLRHELHAVESVLFGLVVGLSFYYLYRAAQHRFQFRRALMRRMYLERMELLAGGSSNDNDEENGGDAKTADGAIITSTTPLITSAPGMANMESFLKVQEPYIHKATAICGCIPKDAIGSEEEDEETTLQEQSNTTHNRCGADFCHCTWKSLSALCFGACCGCWCQCLGMCAMAQEDRELQILLPKERFSMDFITFQPWHEYAPKLEGLRRDRINNMLAHFEALSLLSKHLIRMLLLVLGAMTVIALSGIDPFFQPIHLLVVVMVLLQAFVIIYFVHWLFNRFDLSFDAVVKYFASGFVLCTTNAFVYEIIVSSTLSFGGTIVRIVVITFMVLTGRVDEMDDEPTGTFDNGASHKGSPFAGVDDDRQPVAMMVPVWVLVIVAFLNAFAVAAMVEEVSKYFGFWMVEHPDLQLPEDQNSQNTALTGTEDSNASNNNPSSRGQRSFRSIGAGITVAMVTTAAGFACCENFIYVFFYSRPASVTTEITTLIVRSIFPVHPLAAAIQSIGVCRRDIEKDRSTGFWWILFPALFLHGSFDFALMFLELLMRRSQGSEDDDGAAGGEDDKNPSAAVGTNDGTPGSLDSTSLEDGEVQWQQLQGLITSVCIVLIGIIYYILKATSQRRRLKELDKRRQGNAEYEQLD